MSQFINIDKELNQLAKSLNANLSIDRPNGPEIMRTFEERRIDWVDDEINKAIIIQPTFQNDGVNSKLWNVINIAWINDFSQHPRPQWRKYLIVKKPFEIIEKNIGNLLLNSKQNLIGIKRDDLS